MEHPRDRDISYRADKIDKITSSLHGGRSALAGVGLVADDDDVGDVLRLHE